MNFKNIALLFLVTVTIFSRGFFISDCPFQSLIVDEESHLSREFDPESGMELVSFRRSSLSCEFDLITNRETDDSVIRSQSLDCFFVKANPARRDKNRVSVDTFNRTEKMYKSLILEISNMSVLLERGIAEYNFVHKNKHEFAPEAWDRYVDDECMCWTEYLCKINDIRFCIGEDMDSLGYILTSKLTVSLNSVSIKLDEFLDTLFQ